MGLDLEEALRILGTLPANQTILGDWHVHPNDTNGKASPQDITSWERYAEYFGRPFLGVISHLVSTRGGSDRLELSATLVRRHPLGGFEHREVEIERSY